MIPVLTKKQAYKLDKETIESGHLSQEDLMDNAGKAVAQFFCETIQNPFSKTVVVVCGKGNNGGDGVIAHSYLKKYNVSSKIVFTQENHGHSKLLKKYKISKSQYSIYNDKIKFNKYDWVIDGIFGIGFSRMLNYKYKQIISNLNQNKKIISIDTPSGTFEFEKIPSTEFVVPKYILTFNYYKLSHFNYPFNNIVVKEIGLNKASNTLFSKIEFSDVSNILNDFAFKIDRHKKNSECLIYAGNQHYPGAAILSSLAANKAGSGYINLYTECYKSIQSEIPEIIVKSPLDLEGSLGPHSNNILIGPGDTHLFEFMDIHGFYDFDSGFQYVLDAGHFGDSELVLEDNVYNFDEFPHNCIMTPHLGEFWRFLGFEDNYNNQELYLEILTKIQNGLNERILILKSFNTFIITNDMIYIMDRGPSLLATAGTGDVLSGILVSLLSQGYSRLEASILGTYLHAEAANYYMNNISKDGMTASDLINCIPHAFNELRKENELQI